MKTNREKRVLSNIPPAARMAVSSGEFYHSLSIPKLTLRAVPELIISCLRKRRDSNPVSKNHPGRFRLSVMTCTCLCTSCVGFTSTYKKFLWHHHSFGWTFWSFSSTLLKLCYRSLWNLWSKAVHICDEENKSNKDFTIKSQ